MDLALIKSDVVKASHILHQQGVAAAFGHVSARIPATDTFIFPPRMSPALCAPTICWCWTLKEINSPVMAVPTLSFGYMPGFTKPDRMFRRFAMFIRRVASC
jgi:hypothetical protein